jgi:hypothetical protein
MDTGKSMRAGESGRPDVVRVLNAAEKAVLEATGRCGADSRAEVRLAERFLGIARRRFILKDWDEARMFGRQAIAHAERATRGTGTDASAPDPHDPS